MARTQNTSPDHEGVGLGRPRVVLPPCLISGPENSICFVVGPRAVVSGYKCRDDKPRSTDPVCKT
jgi:hypothetical protein